MCEDTEFELGSMDARSMSGSPKKTCIYVAGPHMLLPSAIAWQAVLDIVLACNIIMARNFLDLEATLKLSYLWSGPTVHSCSNSIVAAKLHPHLQNRASQNTSRSACMTLSFTAPSKLLPYGQSYCIQKGETAQEPAVALAI